MLIPLYLGESSAFLATVVVPGLASAGQKSWFMRAKHLWLLTLCADLLGFK